MAVTEIEIENENTIWSASENASENGKANETEKHPNGRFSDYPHRWMRRRTRTRDWKSSCFCFDFGSYNCESFRYRGFGRGEIDDDDCRDDRDDGGV